MKKFIPIICFLLLSSCRSNKSVGDGKYIFKKPLFSKCIPTNKLDYIRNAYFAKYPYQKIFIYPLFTSKKNDCLGLLGAYTELSPDRPILIFDNQIFFHEKGNQNRNDSIIFSFKEKFGSEFDPYILEEIERHFVNGAIQYFIH